MKICTIPYVTTRGLYKSTNVQQASCMYTCRRPISCEHDFINIGCSLFLFSTDTLKNLLFIVDSFYALPKTKKKNKKKHMRSLAMSVDRSSVHSELLREGNRLYSYHLSGQSHPPNYTTYYLTLREPVSKAGLR